MTGPHIDYEAVFRDLATPVMLLTPDFVVADANKAYLDATGRTREQLVGRNVFDAFPDNPTDPHATGVRTGSQSLGKVLTTGKADAISLQKYDLEVPGMPGLFAPRYWNLINAPVVGSDGEVQLIAHCVEEITEHVHRIVKGLQEGDAGEDG